MYFKKIAHLGFILLFILLAAAACAPSTTATPTPSETPAPTETLAPTETPAPTATVQPTETTAPQAGDSGAAAGAGDTSATATTGTGTTGGAAAGGSSGGTVADKYQYLGQDVADRSQFLPGRTVTITWTVKNAGTNGWNKDYTLVYFSGPKAAKDIYTFGKDVPPGKTINFVVTFTTPAQPGDYDMWFKLRNLEGKNFGDLDLVYTVTNNPVKATATPKK